MRNEVYEYRKALLEQEISDHRREVENRFYALEREMKGKPFDFTMFYYRDIIARADLLKKEFDKLYDKEKQLGTLIEIKEGLDDRPS